MTPIAIATEDELSEAIALRLIAEVPQPHHITLKLRKDGFGYLRSKMDNWRAMAAHQVMVVLTDLDRANCLVEFRNAWLSARPLPANLLLRVAVREVESWLLADHIALRALIGSKGSLPGQPDELPDPKQFLLQLAKTAPKAIREDLVKTMPGHLAQGLGYNTRLTALVNTQWCPERAAERSPSLARARLRLHEAVHAFSQS